MSFRRYVKEIEVRIGSNREKGAAELYEESLQILKKWLDEQTEKESDFIEIMKALFRAQPCMAPMLNLVNELLLSFEQGWKALREKVNLLLRKREDSKKFLIESALSELSRHSVFFTVSYSSTVIDFLRRLGREKKIAVLIPQGFPGNYGVKTAKAIKNGVELKVVSDSLAPSMIKEAEVFITGADSITEDHVVNGVGTFPLALAAKFFGVPFYVLSDTSKFLPKALESHHFIKTEELQSEGLKVLHASFDRTPLELVSRVVTEEGVFPPWLVADKIKKTRISRLLKLITEEGYEGR